MKPLALAVAFLLAAVSAFAQGQLIFQNSATTMITNALTGFPSAGSALAQDDTQVGLYVTHVNETVSSMVIVAVTNCSSPGRFSGGTRTLSGWTGTVRVQVRCWLANTVYPSYEAAYSAAVGGDGSVLLGVSNPFNITLSEPPFSPPFLATSGLTHFFVGGPPPPEAPSFVHAFHSVIGTNTADGTRSVRLTAVFYTGNLVTSVKFMHGLSVPYAATNGPVAVGGSQPDDSQFVTVLLSPGLTYHWSAVATNNLGTATLPDQTFTLGIPGDLNSDGFVSQSELNVVYGHYATNSPWLALTNVAGLGGTNVTFALSNAALGAYTVQYSTNLSNWFPLGLASPRYGFTDTNAPGSPTRSYRLRYP